MLTPGAWEIWPAHCLLAHCLTADNAADLFTEALPQKLIGSYSSSLGIVPHLGSEWAPGVLACSSVSFVISRMCPSAPCVWVACYFLCTFGPLMWAAHPLLVTFQFLSSPHLLLSAALLMPYGGI